MTDIVDMWHDERGAGDPVVLLHGGAYVVHDRHR
jgi:hypothetical protein